MLMQLVGPSFLALPKGRIIANMSRQRIRLFLAVGGAFYFQSFFTLQGLSRSTNVDYVLSLKACEPLTTVVLMLMLQGSVIISTRQVASIALAVLGLLISAGAFTLRQAHLEVTWQAMAFITFFVFVANFCVSTRNLILFAASECAAANGSELQVKMSKGTIFTTSCAFAFCIGVPLCALIVMADLRRGGPELLAQDLAIASAQWRDVLVCSASFGLYNYCSFVVLSFVQPALHSLLASAKRLFAVALVWIVEFRTPGEKEVVGMVLLIAGAMGVELFKPPETEKSKVAKAAVAKATVETASSLRSMWHLAVLSVIAVAPAWSQAIFSTGTDKP